MGTLREELVTILEEEEEDDDEEEQEEEGEGKNCVEENKGLSGKQGEGCSGNPYPAQRLPDFEMTI